MTFVAAAAADVVVFFAASSSRRMTSKKESVEGSGGLCRKGLWCGNRSRSVMAESRRQLPAANGTEVAFSSQRKKNTNQMYASNRTQIYAVRQVSWLGPL